MINKITSNLDIKHFGVFLLVKKNHYMKICSHIFGTL